MKKILILLIFSATAIYSQLAPEWEMNYNLNAPNNIYLRKVVLTSGNDLIYAVSSNKDTNNMGSVNAILIVKVNSNGSLVWRRTYRRNAPDTSTSALSVCVDNQNNIYVLGLTSSETNNLDVLVLKYDANGGFQWQYTYTSYLGSSSEDLPQAMSVDPQGNLVITGSTGIQNYVDSVLVLKLNPTGGLLWKRTFARMPSIRNSGKCLLIDNSSNIYVGGILYDSNNGYWNAGLLKYNSSGNLLWQRIYDHNNNFDDVILDMAFDSNGDIIATGGTNGYFTIGSMDMMTQKYNSAGTLQWTHAFRDTTDEIIYGTKLKVDNNNNIFVLSGVINNYDNFGVIHTLKYNSSGNLLWYKTYGNLYEAQSGKYITFSSNYDLIVAGGQTYFGRPTSILLRYSNSNGNLIWNYRYSTPGVYGNAEYFAEYGSDGKLYCAGLNSAGLQAMRMQPTNAFTQTFRRSNLNKTILDNQLVYDTIMFNTDVLPPEAYLRFISVSIDTLLHTAAGDLEISLISGGRTDTIFYRRGGSFDNLIGTNICDTSSQNICNNGLPPFTGYYAPCRPMSGRYFLPGTGPWILRIYDRRVPETGILKSWSLTLGFESPIGLLPISTEIPERFSLSQNYPNPFNPATKIRFNISNSANVKLQIFDILGKEVKMLINSAFPPGVYETDFDASTLPSGVYFYRLTAGTFSESKKMVLLK